ncbi:N-acetylmuramoyl-L-alanine amidase family protein [Roseibacillus ishigakijimensis]|uniref:N-acetylmuramoyl-L-alanine amidase n=1 Tax=Roseibacillus ishigakijimensis TaxID=454146 RepID=A0A934RQM9_9BACT|nr:N-acetylmuramoyl-L-alanine amidase [Roseibacillus ishigakijimensis]MBK1833304.1 N-acetylmuramoyl-L-alanine amidase [Roseibacillus ishigakijimensis]
MKPFLFAALSLIACCLLLNSCASRGPSSAPSAAGVSLTRDEWGHREGPRGFRTVIIDAGHGGHDSGAVSRTTGQKEKDLALDTAQRLKKKLSRDFEVIMLRESDRFIDLDERVRLASQRDGAILLSLHYNSTGSGGGSTRGPETYYWRVDSHGLASRIQEGLEAVVPSAQGNAGLKRRRLRLTRNPDVPCVLLEFGYLSNSTEARLCANPSYRERLADSVARAVSVQARLGDQGTGARPQPLWQPPSRPTDPPGS